MLARVRGKRRRIKLDATYEVDVSEEKTCSRERQRHAFTLCRETAANFPASFAFSKSALTTRPARCVRSRAWLSLATGPSGQVGRHYLQTSGLAVDVRSLQRALPPRNEVTCYKIVYVKTVEGMQTYHTTTTT